MEPVSFESARKKEILRNRIRESRHRLLDKAKVDFKKRERRDKKRREQEKWMLPELDERLAERKKNNSEKKSNKKDKKKKHKKEKKCKKSKTKSQKIPVGDRIDSGKNDSDSASSSSSSSSAAALSEDDFDWVDKKAATTSAPSSLADFTEKMPLQRASWMISSAEDLFVPTLNRDELLGTRTKGAMLQEEEKRKRRELEKPGQYERELNPYWKDGGTGLPESVINAAETVAAAAAAPTVGDGGVRWLERAYRRAKEQAAEENRSLEEVAAERWGSLEKLETMLKEARLKDRDGGHRDKGDEDRRRRHVERSPRRCEFRRPVEGSLGELRPSYGEAKLRSSFLKPDYDGESHKPDDRNSSATSSSPSRSARDIIPGNQIPEPVSKSTHIPRWKKKEFAKMTTALDVTSDPEPIGEPDKIAKKAEPNSECKRDSPLKFVEIRTPENVRSSPPRLTDKQMNDLGAKIIKAELLGNNELAAKLRSQLEFAKEVKSKAEKEGNLIDEQVVIVKSKRVESDRCAAGVSGVRLVKKQRVETHDADGQRVRYFADDDKYSLKQMFEREKMGTAEDHNAMFARLAGKGAMKTTDDEFDVDETLAARASRHVTDEKMDEQMRQRMLQEHRRSNAAMDNCRMCFEGKDTPKHLMVSIGIRTYLMLPPYKSLTSGHCFVVPMEHVSAATFLDEDVWSEMQIFRKGLTRMFEDLNQDVVFFETSLNLKRFPHMVMQCVPLPKDVGNLAPMYFKKAILESEIEWSNNKKLVDLSQKDVRRAVPKGLPYFSVDFGPQNGFAHVVEDEQLFPKNFASEIIGGLLDLDPAAWRRPPRESFDDQRKKVLQFAEWWKPYDWTRRLKEVG